MYVIHSHGWFGAGRGQLVKSVYFKLVRSGTRRHKKIVTFLMHWKRWFQRSKVGLRSNSKTYGLLRGLPECASGTNRYNQRPIWSHNTRVKHCFSYLNLILVELSSISNGNIRVVRGVKIIWTSNIQYGWKVNFWTHRPSSQKPSKLP